jgi:crossover junction endodeoxyribonuclease RuvC
MNILAIDLATKTGWALDGSGVLTSGTISFKGGRYEGGGMRYLRFGKWLREMIEVGKPDAVYFEEVRRHMSTDAAHVHGGLLAVMQAECEARQLPYAGIPVGTIKKAATGKGNAGKGEMVPIYRPKTHFHREVEGYEDGPF